MSIVRAFDVAYVRFRAPDLDRSAAFLADFGMLPALRSQDRLFMRGHGTQPFLHVTERGDPAFAGFAITLTAEQDLHRLAEATGSDVFDLDTPGGGQAVRLTDPDGFIVDAVYGQTPSAPLPVAAHLPWNQAGVQGRIGKLRRVAAGPAHVLRLGHVVLGVSDFRRSEAWYKEHFGLVTSDEIQPAPGVAIGAFLRCDRGDLPCDHHTVFLLQRPAGPPGFMHSAFEVADLDDLMAGHDYLKGKEARSIWGIGRHVLGSQVFDYWLDPWGFEIEHWTDGDQLRTADGGNIASIPDLLGVQWGMKMPPHPDAPAQD